MAFTGLGAGILGDPYQITTWAQFKEIAANLSSHFKLMNDITASGDFGACGAFSGVFDGDNKTISAIFDNGSYPVLFPLNEGIFKKVSLIVTNSPDSIFGDNTDATATQNSIFEDINITSLGAIKFCGNMAGCQLTNISLVCTGSSPIVTLGTIINNCTFTNVYIHAFGAINIGYGTTGVLQGSTFTDCKFISRPTERSTTVSNVYTIRTKTVHTTTFTHCLFFAPTPYLNTAQITDAANIPTYLRCSFIAYWNGNYNNNATTEILTLSMVGNCTKCYFGGRLKISFTYIYIGHPKYFNATDCHLAFKIEVLDAPSYYPIVVFTRSSGSQTNTYTRIFNECEVINGAGNKSTFLGENGTDCFINNQTCDLTKIPTTNYTGLTTAQTKDSVNFTNFDFNTVWQINQGETPKLRDVIYDPTPHFISPFDRITVTNLDLVSAITTIYFKCVLIPDEWTCYFGSSLNNIELSENAGTRNFETATRYNSTKALGDGEFYVKVVYGNHYITGSAYHFTIEDLPITTIDIPVGNYITMSSPSVNYVHGTALVNGYLFGATREMDGANFFKLKCDDYSDVTYLTITATGLFDLLRLEQIVSCQGFLWMQSTKAGIYDLLVRVNPTTLEYIVFKLSENNADQALSEPIGTDGTYLYASCQDYVRKISPPLGTLVEYSYEQGGVPIALPANLSLAQCPIIFLNLPNKPKVHSIITDATYIYIACTSTAAPNGVYLGVQVTHLQKINKHTMVTVGDIPIPKTTDDMTQNEEYIFLAPELEYNSSVVAMGEDWGLFAIKKSNLSIKYLKALTSSDYGTNETLRACFGVQYLGDYMLVQKNNKNEAYIIDTSQIENWGDNFPVGGASVARLRFTLNGAAFLDIPVNECTLGSDGKFHANNWTNTNTTVFKFLPEGFTFAFEPIVDSVLIQNLINEVIISGHILDSGSSAITAEGFNYGIDPNNLTETITDAGTPIDFQAVLDELTPGIYFFRAFATNSVGTGYGRVIPFIVGNHLILSNDNDDVITNIRTNNCGFAVRCCKPAPGVEDGVTGTVTDVDGNVYDTIVINEIEWITTDLAVTKYNNNDAIPHLTNAAEWAETENGAYCSYLNL